MGGLQIPDPQTTVEGLQINLIQKLSKKEINKEYNHLLRLTESILLDARRPSINDQFNLGPKEWEKNVPHGQEQKSYPVSSLSGMCDTTKTARN